MSGDLAQQVEQLRSEVAQLERQLEGARRTAAGLSSITRFEQLVQEALNISLEVVGAGAGSIILYDSDTDKLVFKYVVGEKAADLIGLELEPDQGIAGKVFQSGESDISEDVTKRKEHLKEVGERVGYVTQNMVTVALRSVESESIGVLQVLNKAEGKFDEHDVALLEIIGAQIAASLETARLNEEARLAMVVRFIGNISHDVKNLMTPTQTGAETLQLVADDCFAQFDETLSGVCSEEASQQLKEIMDGLRDLYPEMITIILEGCDAVQQRMAEISSAVKGIVSEPHFELVDVPALAERVAALLGAQAGKAGTEVVIEGEEDMPEAVCDKKQIYNLVYNLIFNAMDEDVGASHIVLRVQMGPTEGEFPDGQFFIVECEDDGGGMPPEVKAKLFTDEAVSTKAMGTGLGTRIVKNVVDAHGGIIELWSEQAKGTRITCKIPTTLEPSPMPDEE